MEKIILFASSSPMLKELEQLFSQYNPSLTCCTEKKSSAKNEICFIEIDETKTEFLINLFKNNERNFPKPIIAMDIILYCQKLWNAFIKLNNYYFLDVTRKMLIYVHFKIEHIVLSHKEFELISYLCNKKASASEIIQNLWGYNESAETHTLQTHIYRIRQKTMEKLPLIQVEDGYYTIFKDNQNLQ